MNLMKWSKSTLIVFRLLTRAPSPALLVRLVNAFESFSQFGRDPEQVSAFATKFLNLYLTAEGSAGRRPGNNLQSALSTHMDMLFDETHQIIKGGSATERVELFFRLCELLRVTFELDESLRSDLIIHSFLCAQMISPACAVFLGTQIWRNGFRDQRNLKMVLSAVAFGWRLGRSTKSVLHYDWHSSFELGLNEVRDDLQYGPISGHKVKDSVLQPVGQNLSN